MKFGEVPISEAEGGILAHRVSNLGKGKVITADDVTLLDEQGIETVVVAQLEEGDLGEDEAAQLLAEALVGNTSGLRLTKASTGRVNVVADVPGLAAVSADVINAVNAVDPMVTVATVPDLHRLDAGSLLATIKIISYAVPKEDVLRAVDHASGGLGLHPPQPKTVSLIETYHGEKPHSDKGERALRTRLEALGHTLETSDFAPHQIGDVATKLSSDPSDIICLLTASATSDARDIGPEAVRAAGGELIHFGMPVDPGNLLFLGRIGEQIVLGLPGCARSPALNGADWVLERLICGLDVKASDIVGMGVGGLLKEIPTRPRPRRSHE